MAIEINKYEHKTVWEYDKFYNYIGPIDLTFQDRSRISGKWQIPARCVEIEPPPKKEGYTIFYNPNSLAWDYKEINIVKEEHEKPLEKELTLEQKKEEKIQTFKNYVNIIENEPIEYNGNKFDFDDIAIKRFDIARKALPYLDNISIAWTTADDKNVYITEDDIDMIFVNAAKRSNELHNTYRNLKDRIKNSKDESELSRIIWPTE